VKRTGDQDRSGSPARGGGEGSSGQRPEERQNRQGGRGQGQAALDPRMPSCLEQPDHRSAGQAQRQSDGQATRNPRPPNEEGHGQRSGRKPEAGSDGFVAGILRLTDAGGKPYGQQEPTYDGHPLLQSHRHAMWAFG